MTAIFEQSTASARQAPLTQELVRAGLHSSCMIPKLSAPYQSTQILQGIQIKLALIVDTNFIVEPNGGNDRIGCEDDPQLE